LLKGEAMDKLTEAEDLRDIGIIKRIKEDKKENYLSASDIDKLYE
jgi:hypothetical protein